jgi:hypothetical protein
MSSWKIVPVWLFLGAMFVALVGCGGKKGFEGDAAEATKRSQLGEIHDLVFTFAKKHNKQAPKKLTDLQPGEKINPTGYRALKDHSIILVYGVIPEEGSSEVLAYEKDADKAGGLVLLGDGNVKKMSADEVKAATKGKP